MYINPVVLGKRTLGLISCNTTTSRPLRPILLNWLPLELLQDSDLSQIIAPHWSSSYPKYLSSDQDKEEQWRVVWARLQSHHSNLASRLSEQKSRYLALCQELNPRTTQVKSSQEPLFRDILPCLRFLRASRADSVKSWGIHCLMNSCSNCRQLPVNGMTPFLRSSRWGRIQVQHPHPLDWGLLESIWGRSVPSYFEPCSNHWVGLPYGKPS